MLDLSPTKLVIIFVVAVLLLGPRRLPQVARQLGAGWRKVRETYHHVDRELREAIPDLPSSHDLVRYARSPVSLLNQLADGSGAEGLVEDPGAPADPAAASAGGAADHWPEDSASETLRPARPLHEGTEPAGPGASGTGGDDWGPSWWSEPAFLGADDPSLN